MKSCSPADLSNEAEFSRRFSEQFPRLSLMKLSDAQRIDFAIVPNADPQTVVGMVEYKARSCRSDAYPATYLNVQKWTALVTTAAATGLPVWFACGFADGDRLYRFRDGDRLPVGYVASCAEAVVLIPIDRFRPLSGAASVA